LARALAVRPEVLLCDEPTSALDPISAGHIERQLFAIKQDYTIVFVTHTLRAAEGICEAEDGSRIHTWYARSAPSPQTPTPQFLVRGAVCSLEMRTHGGHED
jgi:ABC-type proline/glycine betaine transport system ATPase subunit